MRLLIIGGSDAGIEAGLAAQQRDPSVEATVLVADRYPNFSICGIPYHLAGEVPDWRQLAHRRQEELTPPRGCSCGWTTARCAWTWPPNRWCAWMGPAPATRSAMTAW